MELKSYQKKVITDLEQFFESVQKHKNVGLAFDNFWQQRLGPYNPVRGEGMRPYNEILPGAIHLSIKVPTAGGKTFIACNALHTIFSSLPEHQPRAVVWMVPWSNLLDQTINNLSDPSHPYCQKLNALFNNRVSVLSKKDLLNGVGFNPAVIPEQLTIMVLSFASVRAKQKEERKIFETNGQLLSFAQHGLRSEDLQEFDSTSLINVIRNLHPVVVVDESHNAESELSVEMLRNLNPSVVLDLTATPKKNANIISMVPAIDLKKEQMVKLPVIVSNQPDKESVVESAICLRKKLEAIAAAESLKTGKYIRPIVLFQAESKKKEDATTYLKLKELLITYGIPPAEIAIKTATINELKNIDLMSPECPVNYIITINALKEGWDCPFAYILASLADKSSEVDVTQILGRVLRQPYTQQHKDGMLNMSYVITASSRFLETLQNIIESLKGCGFSDKDYRAPETSAIPEPEQKTETPVNATSELLDISRLRDLKTSAVISAAVDELSEKAYEELEKVQRQLDEYVAAEEPDIFTDMEFKPRQYKIRDAVAAAAAEINLPRFVIRRAPVLAFGEEGDQLTLLDRKLLLDGFKLSQADAQIEFDQTSSELYRVDVEEMSQQYYRMTPFKIENSALHDALVEYILTRPREQQLRDIAHQLMQRVGKVHPITDQEILNYISRILGGLDNERLQDFLKHRYTYGDKIREKIGQLADAHAEKTFNDWRKVNKIETKQSWKFKKHLTPSSLAGELSKTLYEREAGMNGLEESFALELSGLENVLFWHRNLDRGKGFSLNGFKSDHYPDFIVVTKNGTVILVETKGSNLNNPDSLSKIRLGDAWSQLSGPKYKYMMVFDKNPPEGGYSLEKVKELIRQL
jgi:type III restriction enzyme